MLLARDACHNLDILGALQGCDVRLCHGGDHRGFFRVMVRQIS